MSSIRYRVFIDGKAMNKRSTAGSRVQMVSISWPSIMYLLNTLAAMAEMMTYIVKTVIRIRTIMAWSWKNSSCSMLGEAAS